MRPLRYSINVTLDGSCDHRVGIADEELHRRAAESLARADALIFGRVVYQMMEAGWRQVARGDMPADMPDWMVPFARTIDAARKYVVSDTLDAVDWNAELIRGDQLENTILELKRQPGDNLLVSGVTLPRALADLGLIDDYEFVVHPVVAGRGPWLLAGLGAPLTLVQVGEIAYASGVVARRYVPKRPPPHAPEH